MGDMTRRGLIGGVAAFTGAALLGTAETANASLGTSTLMLGEYTIWESDSPFNTDTQENIRELVLFNDSTGYLCDSSGFIMSIYWHVAQRDLLADHLYLQYTNVHQIDYAYRYELTYIAEGCIELQSKDGTFKFVHVNSYWPD